MIPPVAIAAAVVLVAVSVVLPRLAGAPPSTDPDVAVAAALAGCAVRLTIADRRAWATALAAAAGIWTMVGLAPLLPAGLELAVSRWALVPHAVVVAGVVAILTTGRRTLVLGALCGSVAAAAGSGVHLPPFVALGLLLVVAVALRMPRAGRVIVTATGTLAAALASLDQRVLGDQIPARSLSSAVDLVVVCCALSTTWAMTAWTPSWDDLEPVGETANVGRWLGRALGGQPLTVSFPSDDGLTIDPAGRRTVPGADAGQLQDDHRTVVAYVAPAPVVDDVLARPVADILASLGTVARLRHRQRVQATRVAASRSRLQAAADDETRRLERQLEATVMARLERIAELLKSRDAPALRSRLDEVQAELRRHARGLDPLAGRTLLEALQSHAQRGVELLVNVELEPGIARTAWFVATEGLTNAAKHVPGARVSLEIRRTSVGVTVIVTDNGPGGADPSGAGLRGLADRVAAAGGTLTVTSGPSGSSLVAVMPSSDKGFPSATARVLADSAAASGS